LNIYLTLDSLANWRHGFGAPLWRTFVSLDNAIFVSLASVCAVGLLLFTLAWQLSRIVAQHRQIERLPRVRTGIFGLLFAASFLLTPPFAAQITRLSPFFPSLVAPIAAIVLLLTLSVEQSAERIQAKEEESDDSIIPDTRRFVAVRLFLSGALAAIGAWESSLGALLAVLTAFATMLADIRQNRSAGFAAGCWTLSFIATFLIEPNVLQSATWAALKPSLAAGVGLGVFTLIGLVPAAILLRRLSKKVRRTLLAAWCAVIIVVAGVDVLADRFVTTSAAERFVRACLAELGERKIVLGDGIFDELFDVLKPQDVRVIGVRSVADRERLVNTFAEGEVITNRALVVRNCYAMNEFEAAAREAGFSLPGKDKDATKKKSTKGNRQLTAKEKEDAVRAILQPIADSLMILETDLSKLPKARRMAEMEKARAVLRAGWHKGVSGTRLSNALLMLDIASGDSKALEADAISALIFDRSDPGANAALGGLRLDEGRVVDAERYLEKGVKGGGASAYRDLARLRVMQDRFAEAEKLAREAVAKGPDDATMYEPLLAALVEQRKLDEAHALLTRLSDMAKKARQPPSPFIQSVRARMNALSHTK